MIGGLNRVCVAAIAVVGVLLLSPAAALADDCGGPSAVNIYTQCYPSAGGGHHSGGGGTHKNTPPSSGSTSTPTTPVSTSKPIRVSARVHKTLARAGADKKLLSELLTNPYLGASQGVSARGSITASPPSALGSAFDLGAGPTVLFSLLLATALLLLGVGGVRTWRHRQR